MSPVITCKEMKKRKNEEGRMQTSTFKRLNVCFFFGLPFSVRHVLALLFRLHRASFQLGTVEIKSLLKNCSCNKVIRTNLSFFVFYVFETTATILFFFLPVCLFLACRRACTVHRGCPFISHVLSANVFLGIIPYDKGLSVEDFCELFPSVVCLCGVTLWPSAY